MSWRGSCLLPAGILILSLSFTCSCVPADRTSPSPRAPISVAGALGGADTAGFARATGPRRFAFPADHGPHPDFRSEWWYLTGQLRAGARRFGYQFTIFRQALAPAAPPRTSAWATRQVYMGHLAVTDVDNGRFVALERLARDGLDLGGAGTGPFRVWVEDWTIAGQVVDLFPLALHASGDGVELALTAGAGRGPVLQGDAGLSAKGPEPGNASYYYSCTRLPTTGRLTIDGVAFEVSGTSWLDREWSTSALGPELEGWDWLALHLSDGRDVMVYRLRRRDGTAAAESRATVIDQLGATRVVDAGGFTWVPTRWWRSPRTGLRYPVSVTVQIPSAGLTLDVRPLLDDQELRLSVQYWEGAVAARGDAARTPITGAGYLELTGYRASP
jgi:predicted secreted hydrolase